MYSNRKRIAEAENEIKVIQEEDKQIYIEEELEEEDKLSQMSVTSDADLESVGSMYDDKVRTRSCIIRRSEQCHVHVLCRISIMLFLRWFVKQF